MFLHERAEASYEKIRAAPIVAEAPARHPCAARGIPAGSSISQTKGMVMWKKALFVLMSLMSLALTACNTVEGAGKDVSAAGRATSQEAREHKNY